MHPLTTYSTVNSPPYRTRSVRFVHKAIRRPRTYCQHTQQARFAGILQADHSDVHLGRPAGERVSRASSAGTDRTAHLPEHPQEPVIDGAKDCSHGGGGGWEYSSGANVTEKARKAAVEKEELHVE